MSNHERQDRAARWPSGVRRPEAMAMARDLFSGKPERIAALGTAIDSAATTTGAYYRAGVSPKGTFYDPFVGVGIDAVTAGVLGDILIARISIKPGEVDVSKDISRERSEMFDELGITTGQISAGRRLTLKEVVTAAIEDTLRITYQSPPDVRAGNVIKLTR
jgi:hypothetical protein